MDPYGGFQTSGFPKIVLERIFPPKKMEDSGVSPCLETSKHNSLWKMDWLFPSPKMVSSNSSGRSRSRNPSFLQRNVWAVKHPQNPLKSVMFFQVKSHEIPWNPKVPVKNPTRWGNSTNWKWPSNKIGMIYLLKMVIFHSELWQFTNLPEVNTLELLTDGGHSTLQLLVRPTTWPAAVDRHIRIDQGVLAAFCTCFHIEKSYSYGGFLRGTPRSSISDWDFSPSSFWGSPMQWPPY